MNSFKILIATVLCLASTPVISKELLDYRLASKVSLASRGSIIPECYVHGDLCGDCNSVWRCLNNNGYWKPVLSEICQGNQTCNNGQCSATPNPKCSPAGKLPFICTSEGVFPDPADCKSYHYCIFDQNNTLIDYSRTCRYGRYGYHAGTTYCQYDLYNNSPYPVCVNYPVPICTKSGQTDALIDNPRMYYVCSLYETDRSVLYPYIYICPNGHLYSNLFGCRSSVPSKK